MRHDYRDCIDIWKQFENIYKNHKLFTVNIYRIINEY